MGMGVRNPWRVTPVVLMWWIKKSEGIAPNLYELPADQARMYLEVCREMEAIRA